MIRALALALLLALAACAAPAAAGVLSQEDATDLAQSLAEAEDDQGICYGWNVSNNFDGVRDVGSLAADRGNAAYVDYEPAKTVPTADHATGKPGSDFLRESWIWLVLCGAAILGGPLFYLYKRSQSKPPPPSPAT